MQTIIFLYLCVENNGKNIKCGIEKASNNLSATTNINRETNGNSISKKKSYTEAVQVHNKLVQGYTGKASYYGVAPTVGDEAPTQSY